jgi:hypothetical protein
MMTIKYARKTKDIAIHILMQKLIVKERFILFSYSTHQLHRSLISGEKKQVT